MIKKISENKYYKELDFRKIYYFFKRNYKFIFSIIFISITANIFFSKIKNTYSTEMNLWVPNINHDIGGVSVKNVINRVSKRFDTKNILNTLLNQENVFRDLFEIRNQEIENLKINEKEDLSFKKWSEKNIKIEFRNDGVLKVNYRDIDPLLIEAFINRTDTYLQYQYVNYFISLIESTKSILDKELDNQYNLILKKIEENNILKDKYGFSQKEISNIELPLDIEIENNKIKYIKNIIKLRKNLREISLLEELSRETLISKEFINEYKNKLNIELINFKKNKEDIFNISKGLAIYDLSKGKSFDQYFKDVGIPNKETLDSIMAYRKQELDDYLKKNYGLGKREINVEQTISLKRLIIFGILYGTTLGLSIAILKDIFKKKLK